MTLRGDSNNTANSRITTVTSEARPLGTCQRLGWTGQMMADWQGKFFIAHEISFLLKLILSSN